MKSIIQRLKWLLNNLITVLAGLFIKRDKSIWLFGSWMGQRYADNPRALFQFLHANKEHYNINRVVWVTNEKSICKKLNYQGYECYMIHSKEGIYYHFKAGVHVICNMYDNMNGYSGDILGRFSHGAIKIQLWHGIGIKAVANMRKSTGHHRSRIFRYLKYVLDSPLFFPGGWNRCYWLVAGSENRRVVEKDFGVYDESRIIYATYPRFLNPLVLFEDEKKYCDLINRSKETGYSTILYLPTFRTKYEDYISPSEINGFQDFLLNNKILWIQKQHLAAINSPYTPDSDNFVMLPPDFDVNLILHNMDIVISDYSSVITDSIYLYKKSLNYIPDYHYYETEDRGFVADFDLYNPGWNVYNPEDLFNTIIEILAITDDELVKRRYQVSREKLIGSVHYDYDLIVEKILIAIKEKK